jgi:hypothetical protein
VSGPEKLRGLRDQPRALTGAIDWGRENPPAQIDSGQFDYAAEDRVIGSMY